MFFRDGLAEVPDSEDEPLISSPQVWSDGAADEPSPARQSSDAFADASLPHHASGNISMSIPEHDARQGVGEQKASMHAEPSQYHPTNTQPNNSPPQLVHSASGPPLEPLLESSVDSHAIVNTSGPTQAEGQTNLSVGIVQVASEEQKQPPTTIAHTNEVHPALAVPNSLLQQGDACNVGAEQGVFSESNDLRDDHGQEDRPNQFPGLVETNTPLCGSENVGKDVESVLSSGHADAPKPPTIDSPILHDTDSILSSEEASRATDEANVQGIDLQLQEGFLPTSNRVCSRSTNLAQSSMHHMASPKEHRTSQLCLSKSTLPKATSSNGEGNTGETDLLQRRDTHTATPEHKSNIPIDRHGNEHPTSQTASRPRLMESNSEGEFSSKHAPEQEPVAVRSDVSNLPTMSKMDLHNQSSSKPPETDPQTLKSSRLLDEQKISASPMTPQEITLANLKAQRATLIASLATLPKIHELIAGRNSSVVSESSSAEPTDQDVTTAANTIVKKHIKMLHDYNEIKDVGQGLMGLIADQRGVRIVEVQDEFGVSSKD